jgi:hypothetical protein
MLDLAAAIIGSVSDVLKLGVLFLRSSGVIRAENLVLRRATNLVYRAWESTSCRTGAAATRSSIGTMQRGFPSAIAAQKNRKDSRTGIGLLMR